MKPSLVKNSYLYQAIVIAFCLIVVVSNIISAKLIKLPFYDLVFPAGLITYPLTFLLSDLVTEIYGAKQAKIMVYIALGMNLLGFAIIEVALLLPAIDSPEYATFQILLGLTGLRMFTSILGFVVSQILDIQIYALIKRWTGSRYLWLRNNGSACIAQLVDTVIIDVIYLYWGLKMEMMAVFPIMLFSYFYKIFFNFANTPLFYLCVYLVNKRWKWKELGSVQ